MDHTANSADHQRRPLDIHPTVLRLREEVVTWVRKHKTAPTIDVLEAALRDLAVLALWDGAEPGRLAQDFLDTVDQLDPKTREVVRLTLGLDHPEESLTTRRNRVRPDKAGGEIHILGESYALAKTLSALLTWKLGQPRPLVREKTLSGFVIREATVTVALGEVGEQHSVTLDAECHEDGARIALVPAVGTFNRRARFTVQRGRGDSREVESGKPIGEISVYPPRSSDHADIYGARYCYYVVPLSPCGAGERVQIEVASAQRTWRQNFSSPPATTAIWWASLGSEERVQIELTAAKAIIGELSAVEGDQLSEAVSAPAVGRAAELVKQKGAAYTWSLTRERPDADVLLALKWSFAHK